MRKHLVKALMLGGVTMLVAGCTTYYRVSRPIVWKRILHDGGRPQRRSSQIQGCENAKHGDVAVF